MATNYDFSVFTEVFTGISFFGLSFLFPLILFFLLMVGISRKPNDWMVMFLPMVFMMEKFGLNVSWGYMLSFKLIGVGMLVISAMTLNVVWSTITTTAQRFKEFMPDEREKRRYDDTVKRDERMSKRADSVIRTYRDKLLGLTQGQLDMVRGSLEQLEIQKAKGLLPDYKYDMYRDEVINQARKVKGDSVDLIRDNLTAMKKGIKGKGSKGSKGAGTFNMKDLDKFMFVNMGNREKRRYADINKKKWTENLVRARKKRKKVAFDKRKDEFMKKMNIKDMYKNYKKKEVDLKYMYTNYKKKKVKKVFDKWYEENLGWMK